MKEKEVALVEAMVVMDCHRNDRKSELENIGIDLKMLHQQCGRGGGWSKSRACETPEAPVTKPNTCSFLNPRNLAWKHAAFDD